MGKYGHEGATNSLIEHTFYSYNMKKHIKYYIIGVIKMTKTPLCYFMAKFWNLNLLSPTQCFFTILNIGFLANQAAALTTSIFL